MKKLLFLLVLILIAAISCKEKKPADYTVLGLYTPYQAMIEKMKGKVETVTEVNYWAVPEGDTYVKGAKMTAKELDSLGYTGDFIARFDEAGDIISCAWLDENKNEVSKWQITKENNLMVRAEYTYRDTVWYYNKLNCNSEGEITEVEIYNAVADTLIQKLSVEENAVGDTIVYNYFDYKGDNFRKVLFLYNTAGLFIGFRSFDKEGNYTGGNELSYDKDGNLSELRFTNKKKEVTAGNIFTGKYDSKGNWISVICKDNKGFAIIGERVYTYFE